MDYRTSRVLDAKVSLLGFGCMRLPTDEHGRICEAEATAMLRNGLEAGINYVDTAHFYLDSQSEPFVGRALADVPRENYYLATKLPCIAISTVAEAERVFALQQERLQTDYFDFYLLHALNRARWELMVESGVLDYCIALQEQGKIRRFGFSFHDDYEVFEEIMRYRHWDFCQIQLNYLDTEEQAGIKGYHLAEALGVPVVIMEPVKGGVLANPPEDIAARLLAARPDCSVASWAMRWVAALPNVLTVLSGMTVPEQVADNLKTYSKLEPLAKSERVLVEQVATELRRRTKNGCTDCRYCMPCPVGVDIPTNFKLWNIMSKCEDGLAAYRPWNVVMPDGAKAKHCVACGKCEALCPQKIPIRADLARAQQELDAVPWVLK